MLSIPGTEALSPAVKYVVAFAIIFVLLALFALVLRRLTGGRLSMPSNDRARSRQPRLGIVDVYDLDRQRQLILLRRDNVEHLLLIGGPNDVIVETNIVRTGAARLPSQAAEQNGERVEALPERPFETPPRPQIEPTQRVEPVVARLGPTDPARIGAELPARSAPAPVPVEPMLKPDIVALAPLAPSPPAPTPIAPTPVPPPPRPVAQPPREPAPPRPVPQQRPAPQPQPVAVSAPEPPAPRPSPETPRQPAPEPVRTKEPTIADAAVLSDMAKQLEEALKRPLSPGRPGPTAAAPAPNGPLPPGDGRFPKGGPAYPVKAPAAASPPPPPAPAPMPQRPLEASEPPASRPRPAPVARLRPAPEPEPTNASPAAAEPPPPSPRSGTGPDKVDPFSVEEIEAEFARLLGRPLDRNDRASQ